MNTAIYFLSSVLLTLIAIPLGWLEQTLIEVFLIGVGIGGLSVLIARD